MPSTSSTKRYPQNWAIISVKFAGRRFEIACEKDKLEEWRKGIECNPQNVFASEIIFSDVQRGLPANEQDLLDVFGIEDRAEIAKTILESEKKDVRMDRRREIRSEEEELLKQVVHTSVRLETRKKFDPQVIESLLAEHKFDLTPFREEKWEWNGRARVAIEFLKHWLDIEYDQMYVEFYLPKKAGASVKLRKLKPQFRRIDFLECWDGNVRLRALINTMDFKRMYALLWDYKRSGDCRVTQTCYDNVHLTPPVIKEYNKCPKCRLPC